MNNHWTYILLGLWIALVPFLGFPGAWKTFLIVIPALVIAALSFNGYLKARHKKYFHPQKGNNEKA